MTERERPEVEINIRGSEVEYIVRESLIHFLAYHEDREKAIAQLTGGLAEKLREWSDTVQQEGRADA